MAQRKNRAAEIQGLSRFVGLQAFEFLQLLRGADVLWPAGGALECGESRHTEEHVVSRLSTE
jgi:hypothetical protein